MHLLARFHQLAVKRGLTPGALMDASPQDFDLLLVAVMNEFSVERVYTERDVNDVLRRWLDTTGSMLEVDHVELRRWLVDLQVLARDTFGRAYTLAPVPPRLAALAASLSGVDFACEFAEAGRHEAERRAARKAAWMQAKADAVHK